MRKILSLIAVVALLSSCGEYYRVQKSVDVSERYSYAKKYYNEGRYSRVITLLEDVLPSLSGSSEGPQATYLMADSYLKAKRETEAAQYFRTYYTSYPKGDMIEEARFGSGYCLYKASPEARLDQTATYGAIQELQLYLDFFPEGKHRGEVERMLFELQDKLAEKELRTSRLYYNLGLYLGNNYQSSVIVAQNALKSFPYTRYREELLFMVFKAKSEEAALSVPEKQQERVREALDHYYNYANEFPEGELAKEARRIYERMSKLMQRD